MHDWSCDWIVISLGCWKLWDTKLTATLHLVDWSLSANKPCTHYRAFGWNQLHFPVDYMGRNLYICQISTTLPSFVSKVGPLLLIYMQWLYLQQTQWYNHKSPCEMNPGKYWAYTKWLCTMQLTALWSYEQQFLLKNWSKCWMSQGTTASDQIWSDTAPAGKDRDKENNITVSKNNNKKTPARW